MITDDPKALYAHLVDLRRRILRALLISAIFCGVFCYFANDLYTFLALPLQHQLPAAGKLIATQVAAPFLVPFKLAMIAALLVSMPVWLYEIWGFVAPGLYHREKKQIAPLLAASIVLFYLGVAFAYGVVLPLVFQFFTRVLPKGVVMMTDMSDYLDFVLKMFLAFGLAFEIPIATVILISFNVVTRANLVKQRPYIILAAFVLAMFMTPPDVVSQTLLAVPMWLLFEAGLLLSYLVSSSNNMETKLN
jgi:sec-independent protein translocase protein TatC